MEADDGAVTLSGKLEGEGRRATYSLRLTEVSENQLGFDLELVNASPDFNRVFPRYGSSTDERFFGFGEQFTFLDLKGRSFPIISQEQGIFRGKESFSSLLELFIPGAGGDWSSTYPAVPQYITNRMRSLFLENDETSFFDLTDPDGVEIKFFGTRMKVRILNGDTPLDLVREFTSYTGRMAPLPDWLNEGAVVGMQGGTTEVYTRALPPALPCALLRRLLLRQGRFPGRSEIPLERPGVTFPAQGAADAPGQGQDQP